jgi:hypothetical protein
MRCLIAVVGLALISPLAICADEPKIPNPLKNAKEGDWAEYKSTVNLGGKDIELKLKMTVDSIKDKKAKITTISEFGGFGKKEESREIEITDNFDPKVLNDAKAGMVEVVKSGSEKVKVGGKEYAATWYDLKTTNEIMGMKITAESKVWISKDAPITGLVKMEMQGPATIKLELTGSGSK